MLFYNILVDVIENLTRAAIYVHPDWLYHTMSKP